ncbi:putative disease resistance RPP13-like protein 1 [Solanum stenotomum]|uniref:putative disease resistance RPP13-like protein 1 n=1 Tax=Solanum stenotomum TaxID=172797 RepID=UPI0020D14BEA|nr:putative disease resistance RPP13-like protein 1 [Solanum stenotomum]
MHGITEVTEEFYGSLSSKKPFNCLEELRFEDMPEWKQWHLLGSGEFPALEELIIKNCPELSLETPIQLSSLKRFKVSGSPKHIAHYLEENTDIYGCKKLKLPQIQAMPYFSHLTSLQSLQIWYFPNLQSLPESALPSSLSHLEIRNCPNLQSLPVKGMPSSLSQLDHR